MGADLEGEIVVRKIHEEDGQVVLLAMVFLAFFGLVITSLLMFSNASILSVARLREDRASVYVADGATEAAIQYARQNAGVGAFGAIPCMQASPFSETDNKVTAPNLQVTAIVDCVSLASPFDQQRWVRFTASVNNVPLVVATVFFYDTTPGVPIDVQDWTYCHSGPCP
jgi:hypothetical protein